MDPTGLGIVAASGLGLFAIGFAVSRFDAKSRLKVLLLVAATQVVMAGWLTGFRMLDGN